MTTAPRTIDRGLHRPVWRQIADILAAEIGAGELGGDGKLPPAKALAERFGVNRHTVRQALMAMNEAGITETRQGAGSFVVGQVVDYPITAKTRFSEIVLSQGMAPSGEVLAVRTRTASAEAAKALGIGPKGRVVMVTRSCRADGMVIGLARHYFPEKRFPEMAVLARESGSISTALKRAGVDTYYRRTTYVSSRLPTAREADQLDQPVSLPVLVSRAINVDADGDPIEYGMTLFSAGRVRLSFGD